MAMKIRQLDVSDLEPCEPLQRIIQESADLATGEILQVFHRREPHLLYPMLEKSGLCWDCTQLAQDRFEIKIWRADVLPTPSSV